MKKILIIGAGFLQLFVIKRAKELGYEVYAVDGNPNAVGYAFADHFETIDIVDSAACLRYARVNGIDGVLTAATDYGVLTAAIVAHELGLNGVDTEVATLIKNKYSIRKCLFENKVDDTEQAYLVDPNTDLEVISQKVTYPVMVKPCDGSGSRGASRVDRAEDFAEACKYAMDSSITHRAEIETFIVGNEYGVESFVENGNIHILAVMKKLMTKHPYYAELGHAIPSGLSVELEEKIKNCVRKALIALGVNFGSVNMDLLVTDDGKVHIIDIGARMGGNLIGSHIIPYGAGIDYMANMLRNAVGDPVDMTVCTHGAVATRLLAFEEGIIKQLPNFEEIEKEYGVEIYHHMTLGQKVNEYHTNLDGLGYIVAKADTVDEANNKAEKVLNVIRACIF